MEKKEIAIIKVDTPVFFPGKFLGGRVENQILVLNPQEEVWKVFTWLSYAYRKKPCRVSFLERTISDEVLMAATEINKRPAETYKYVYQGFLSKETYDVALAIWTKNKVVRGGTDD